MKPIVRALLAATFLGSAISALVPLPALAADKPTQEVAKNLAAAQKAMAAKDYDGALADVKQAQAVSEAPMEATADSASLPDDQKKQVYTAAFQLAANAKHYDKAIVYAQKLEAMGPLDAKMLADVAIAYYNLKDNAHAQQYAQKSIDAAKAAGQQPDQNMEIIIMNGQAQSNDTTGYRTSLEGMVIQYNRPEDWQKLVNVSLGTKGMKDVDVLNLLRLEFFIPGAMRGEDYGPLASAANAQGYATEAYNVLQRGIREGKVTAGQFGQLYTQARSGAATDERELKSIAAEAARAKSGEGDIKLAEDYWGYGRYADGEAAARRAISKGGIKDPNEATTLLGMLLAAQGKYAEAQQTLSQVGGTEGRKAPAHVWSLYAQAQMKGQGTAAQAPATPH